MTDEQVNKVLNEALPVAAVLLVRGGWLSSNEGVEIQVAFAADEKSPALWKVLLGGSHSVYVESTSILGISVERNRELQPVRDVEDQAVSGTPGQSAGFFDAEQGRAEAAA